MAMLADTVDAVVGVDTHTDTHTAVLVDRLGGELGWATFSADPRGYRALITWVHRHAPGARLVWAVEGCRSHGTGLVRALQRSGFTVIEARRPTRASRRPGGKSDPADATRAAREALTCRSPGQPRADGVREALRILLVARAQASTSRTAAVNTLKAFLLSAPDQLRQSLRGLSTARQVQHCARLRVSIGQPISEQTLRGELRRIGQHIRALDAVLRHNEHQLGALVTTVMPALLDQPGIGPMSAAQLLVSWSHKGRCRSEAAFAALAGVSPLQASSGRIVRHRLNRFGDRQLNRAFHVIVSWRMLHHPDTRAYYERRTAEGRSAAEIRRCLKRYTARALFRLMEHAA